MPPQGYAVLVRDAAAFQQAFPDVDFVEPPSWPALNNGGDAVVLAAEATVLDSVAYRTSWGGDGVSLERIDPGGPANVRTNWGSTTDPRGGTPGAANSIFAIDTEPPQLRTVVPSTNGDVLSVTFSEPLDPGSVAPSAFTLTPDAAAITEAAVTDTVVTLRLSTALPTGDYTLTVQGVQDFKGNTLDEATASFSFVRPGTPDPQDVVVNEILYDPPEADLEFVELLNRSDETFDLRRFALADNRGDPVSLTDAPTPLDPGAYAVLVQDAEAFRQAFPDVAVIEPPSWPTLNNGGDAVVLSVDGSAIDSVNYAPSWGGDGVALERIDPAGASNNRFNWASSTADAGGTPGAQNSQFAPDLAPPRPIFAEQTDEDEVEVFFDEPLDPTSVTSDDFQLADGRTPRLAFLQGENTSVLLRFDGTLSGVTLTVQDVRDLKGNALDEAAVPLAYRPTPGALLLNEIMYDPLADPNDGLPDQPEYVEFVNASAQPLSLRGLYWTDVPDETGEADTLRLGMAFRRVAPDSFAVAFANGDATEDQTTLQAAFPALAFDADALLPQDRTTLGLVNGGDLIRLHRADDAVLDEAFYDPDWHNPNLRDAAGVALERVSPTAPTDDAATWNSSVADAGGTPGRTNTVALPPSPDQADTGVTIAPSPFSPDGDGFEDQTRIQFTLSSTVTLVRARLYDARGRHVRTLEQARLAGRTGELVWDGLDDDGNDLRMGIYVVLLEAIDTNGGTTDAFKEPVVLARPLD
ncbi:MAG: hypothetical protein GVY18_00280 [Bacteroidetes bacterium]|nr:hypothetical protein [Bacteroidota bacterium]